MDEGNSSALSTMLDQPRSDANADRAIDLKHYAEQLIHIAEELRRAGFDPALQAPSLRSRPEDRTGRPAPNDQVQFPTNTGSKRHYLAQIARSIYNARRQREDIFGSPDLFGEPAWDIMLDLYVAHVEGKPVSVSSACIGSASPSTTGLRWLGILADQDLIIRAHDPDDQRRVLVRLTETGLAAMDRYLESTPDGSAIAG